MLKNKNRKRQPVVRYSDGQKKITPSTGSLFLKKTFQEPVVQDKPKVKTENFESNGQNRADKLFHGNLYVQPKLPFLQVLPPTEAKKETKNYHLNLSTSNFELSYWRPRPSIYQETQERREKIAEEFRTVERVLDSEPESNFLKCADFLIELKSMKRLAPGQWLNDEVINSYTYIV